MAEDKDYFGEKLRLAERAREDAYFRKVDQALLAQMRQQDRATGTAASPAAALFASILVPVDFSPYAANALRYALGIAERFLILVLRSCGGTPHPNLPPQGGKGFCRRRG